MYTLIEIEIENKTLKKKRTLARTITAVINNDYKDFRHRMVEISKATRSISRTITRSLSRSADSDDHI